MDNRKYYTVKELPDELKPYEKVESFGTGALSDAELLAVIIKNGSAGERSTELAARILCHNDGAGLMNLHTVKVYCGTYKKNGKNMPENWGLFHYT